MKHEKYFLWLFLVFYILSVSAKQQSLHLPVAVLLLSVFYKKNLTCEEYRNIFRFSIAGIFIMAAYFAVNTFLYKDYGGYSFVSNFWKKPLSTVGTFLIAIVPNEAEMLYTFFLTHKTIAVLLFIILLISVIVIAYMNRARSKNAVVFALIFVFSFFPSAFAESSLRIIGVQVFLVYTLLGLMLISLSARGLVEFSKSRLGGTSSLIYALLLILLVLNVNASIRQYSDEYQLDVFRKDYLSKLDEYFKANNPVNVLIVTAPYSIMLPYQYYFFSNHKFGKYPVAISPTGYSYNYKNFTEGDVKNAADTFVTAELSGSIASVWTNRDYISNYLSINFPETSEFEITEKIPDTMRGFKEVKFTIPERYLSFDKIYYNGIEWLKLSDPHIIKQNPNPGITDNPLNPPLIRGN